MPNQHGGKREGAGRKPLGASPLVRYDVRLSPEDAAYLREQGGGNLSAGVRKVVAVIRQQA